MLQLLPWFVGTLLTAWLRRGRIVRKGRIDIIAIGCNDDEMKQIRALDEMILSRLGATVAYHVGILRSFPRLRLVCLGTDAPPSHIRRYFGNEQVADVTSGIWLARRRVAVARMQSKKPFERIVVHELAHAAIDLWTDRFPYPTAIHEGFAFIVELIEARARGWRRPQSESEAPEDEENRPAKWMSDASVREILAYRRCDFGDLPTDELAKLNWQMCYAGLWLLYFLTYSDTLKTPILYRVLPGLRRANCRTPDAVYNWMLKETGMDEASFERAFRAYVEANSRAGHCRSRQHGQPASLLTISQKCVRLRKTI